MRGIGANERQKAARSHSFCTVAQVLRRRNATRKYRGAEFGYYGQPLAGSVMAGEAVDPPA